MLAAVQFLVGGAFGAEVADATDEVSDILMCDWNSELLRSSQRTSRSIWQFRLAKRQEVGAQIAKSPSVPGQIFGRKRLLTLRYVLPSLSGFQLSNAAGM